MTKRSDDLVRECAGDGRIIETAWLAFRMQFPEDMNPLQLYRMRLAFYTGAQYAYQTVMAMEGPATPKGLSELHSMQKEFERFENRVGPDYLRT